MWKVRLGLRKLARGQLGGLAGDTAYVTVFAGAVSLADLAQLALITRSLGLSEYGRLAVVMSVVVLVGALLRPEVMAATTLFGARCLAMRDIGGLASVAQASYALRLVGGFLSLIVVIGLALTIGDDLVSHGRFLLILYGATLLVSAPDETAHVVIRLLGGFRLAAGYTVALETLRIGLIATALAVIGNLMGVVIALLIYEFVTAVAITSAAGAVFRRTLMGSIGRPTFRALSQRRAMLRVVAHTNAFAYARVAQIQLPTILIGVVSSSLSVGIYKLGMAGATLIGRFADPVTFAVIPRQAKLWAAARIGDLRELTITSTYVSAGAMTLMYALAVIFRVPILHFLGGPEGSDAAPVLVIAGAGQAINSILFWNYGALWAAGKSGLVAVIALLAASLQSVLLVPFVWRWGIDGAAVAYLLSMIALNVGLTASALRVMSRAR